ncbi:MAG: hypothetical protein ACE5EK_05330 [Nitrospinales bacterium]
MKKAGFLLLILLLLPVGFPAPEAMANLQIVPRGDGTVRKFDASFDSLWTAVPTVVNDLGWKVVTNNKNRGYLLVQKEGTQGIAPELLQNKYIAIFFDRVAENVTTLEVVSDKNTVTGIGFPNWERLILDKLEEQLRIR